MERVAFLVERTGERLSCLLNPEHLDARRIAGVRVRSDGAGVIAGALRSDDPLIASGGGSTEFELRLLFDVDLANEGYHPAPGPQPFQKPAGAAGTVPRAVPPRHADVRELTRPLWQLAENAEGSDGHDAVPVVRFIWGKSWNVPAAVLAIAERFDRFDADGAPRRSWLSLRMRRVPDARGAAPATLPATPQFELDPGTSWREDADEEVIEVPPDHAGPPPLRLDLVAAERYGNPAWARWLGEYNRLDDLLELAGTAVLRLPPAGRFTGAP